MPNCLVIQSSSHQHICKSASYLCMAFPIFYLPHAPGLLISPPDFPFDVIKQSLSLMIRICMQVSLGKLIRPLRYPLDREEIKHSSFSGNGKQMWRVMLNQGVSSLWLVTQRHDRGFNFTELIRKRDFAQWG